jgi:rfaE bifunctional protein nucleotidyltransferase chain/domain
VPGPVLDLVALQAELAFARERGARIVLTNGVFDVLHVGHLRYLRAARGAGDVLVVGVNADHAVGKPGRPLVPEAERAEMVAALEPVDYVVLFGDPTADALLRAVAPHVYAKGADYTRATLPEAATARSVGARLLFIPLVQGRSTSALLEKLGDSPNCATD